MENMPETNSDAAQVLIIEDDRKLCRLIKTYLERFGYEISMEHTGPEGLVRAHAANINAVILDVMLPGMNGTELLKRLREKSNVPVLMFTGLGEEADRITGLEIGADDYLSKTVSMRELLARLRAVIRRSRIAVVAGALTQNALLTSGPLTVDAEARRATLDGQVLVLTAVEFDMLHCLIRGCGRVQTREHLLLEVADRDFEGFDRSIDVHISALRRKLGDDAKSPRFIHTVRSVGYMIMRPKDGLTERGVY